MRAMADQGETRGGFFRRLKDRLSDGRGLGLSLDVFRGRSIDDEMAEELETQLLLADTGLDAALRIVGSLRKRMGSRPVEVAEIQAGLRDAIQEILAPRADPLVIPDDVRPFLLLMVGVNGSGKTTTIGKLARLYREQGLQVLLAAGDTYRAAAVEQLQAWGQRNSVPVVSQAAGADPAAVIYDAFEAARVRGIDIVLADTAGRLQNQAGLMQELAKVVRVAGRLDPHAPHEKMLVLDASLGQNAIAQAEQFHQAVGLTGITMTKLDGGAKGGVLVSIADRLEVPIRFICVGEQPEDMAQFDAREFAQALVAPMDADA